jgi:hypothetical protein
MPLPTNSNVQRSAGSGLWIGPSTGPFHDPSNFNEVFLGAFRRDVLSFYPGSRIEREPAVIVAGSTAPATRVSPTFALDFQLDEESGGSRDSVRVALFGVWYRLSVPRSLGLGPRDHDLIRAVGRVMELHHQVLFRWSRVSLLQLRRGMPEDHYIAAAVDPSAYSSAASSPSRIAEAILTLRTMALSTYENRRVTTGTLIIGTGSRSATDQPHAIRDTSPEALTFGVELTGLKTLHRLCDGRRTVFLVDQQGRLTDLVDIRHWAIHESRTQDEPPRPESEDEPEPVLSVPCPRVYMFHALATRTGGHVCLVLSPNQEIKVFAGGVQAFVFAHGRWRVLDPESKFALWEGAVANPRLARVLFQTALDLAEERQGGLLVVVSDPARAIGRLIAPHDVLEFELDLDPQPGSTALTDAIDRESPARPFSLFGLTTQPETSPGEAAPADSVDIPIPDLVEPLSKRSVHYLARGGSVTKLDAAVLEALAGLDGALVADSNGRLLAFGAILRHDLHSLSGGDLASPPALAEGARTTAALVASRFGPVLKISEDGIISCFLDGARAWDL